MSIRYFADSVPARCEILGDMSVDLPWPLRRLQKQAWLALLPALGLAAASADAQTKPPAKFHLQEAGIADIQRAILTKQITSTGVVELYLKRIKAYNNACVNEPTGILGPDHDDSAREADQCVVDAEPASGGAREMGLRRAQGA